ncbi:transposase, partial [Sphingomonas sp. 2378]|uniref:transposase n=1 Tax=Sphingomonas sp. 2378 TaxID=1219748 RepID=UPI00311B160C
MTDFFWFSDAQWERIAPLLPTGVRGKARVDDRRVLSGIVHALRCGGRWADCADVYGPKKTLYNRFVRWAERGVWEGIFSALAGADGAPDRLFIDSSCIKVH